MTDMDPFRSPSAEVEERQDSETATAKRRTKMKLVVFLVLAVVVAVAAYLFRDTLTLAELAKRETQLREFQSNHPLATFAIAFVVYVLVTGLSLPGAAPLTLVYGWYFGWLPGVILVSFASTAGATVAFLASRYLLRDAVQSRYGETMKRFQARLEEEGPFYLFTLRLIPAVPFFVINLVMGLTPIATRTFWWVSQVGMFAGTCVYVYAGSRVPDLNVLAEEGIQAVFEPSQLTQILLAFVLLGVFPLLARWMLRWIRGKRGDIR
jgi:uncharacterized membrane protein YdjX (TVP38/TMEM64 family)